MATFSERLKSLRSEKGWSQQRLADELKLSKSSVNMYERGEREPGFETMEAIADTFNVDMDYLYGRTDVKIAEPIQFNADTVPPGFRPLPEMTQVPLIGNIACGTPITAEENIKQYIGVPAAWRADFALECHGDSMAPGSVMGTSSASANSARWRPARLRQCGSARKPLSNTSTNPGTWSS